MLLLEDRGPRRFEGRVLSRRSLLEFPRVEIKGFDMCAAREDMERGWPGRPWEIWAASSWPRPRMRVVPYYFPAYAGELYAALLFLRTETDRTAIIHGSAAVGDYCGNKGNKAANRCS